MDALCAIQGERLVVVLGGVDDQLRRGRDGRRAVRAGAGGGRAGDRGPGSRPPLGPRRRSRRTAPPPGWPEAPRPVRSEDLLPERALAGDGHARRHLVEEVYLPLISARGALVETLTEYFAPRVGHRGHRAGALRPPQHRPLPPAPGRRPDRPQPHRAPARVHPPDRPGAGEAVGTRRGRGFVGTRQSSAPEIRAARRRVRVPSPGRVDMCSSSSRPDRAPRPPAS